MLFSQRNSIVISEKVSSYFSWMLLTRFVLNNELSSTSLITFSCRTIMALSLVNAHIRRFSIFCTPDRFSMNSDISKEFMCDGTPKIKNISIYNNAFLIFTFHQCDYDIFEYLQRGTYHDKREKEST